MKKFLLICILALLCKNIFGKEDCHSREGCPALEEIYSLIVEEVNEGDLRNTIEPLKIKYCKKPNTDETFTVFKHQPCNDISKSEYFYDKKHMIIEKGKKIKEKEFLELNPDFNYETNLVCVANSYNMITYERTLEKQYPNIYQIGSYGCPSDIFFISHTNSNKIYLNNHAQITSIRFTQYHGNSIRYDYKNERRHWSHQGLLEKNDEGDLEFKFYSNSKEKFGVCVIQDQYHSNPTHRCFANDEYWNNTYMGNQEKIIVSKDDKNNTNNKNSSTLISLLDSPNDSKNKKNTINNIEKDDFLDFGKYEELIIPDFFKKKIGSSSILRKAGQEFYYRFVTKKHSLNKYPEKALEGMVWFEIYFNENLKNPKAINVKFLTSLLNLRESLRNNIGISQTSTIQNAIDHYWVLSILSSNQKYEKNNVSPQIEERKQLLTNLNQEINFLLEKENFLKNEIILITANYSNDLKNLSKLSETNYKNTDKILLLLEKKLEEIYQSENLSDIELTKNLLKFITISINEILDTFPKNKVIVSKNNNLKIEELFNENQIKVLAKIGKDNQIKQNEKIIDFVETTNLISEKGFESNDIIDNIGEFQLGVNKRTGLIQSYIKLKSINETTDLGRSTTYRPKPNNPYGIGGGMLPHALNSLFPKSLYYFSTTEIDEFDTSQLFDDGTTLDDIMGEIQITDDILPGFDVGEVDSFTQEFNEGKDPEDQILGGFESFFQNENESNINEGRNPEDYVLPGF